MRLPMTRFYALGDEPFGSGGRARQGGGVLPEDRRPQAATPLEFETQGATSGSRRRSGPGAFGIAIAPAAMLPPLGNDQRALRGPPGSGVSPRRRLPGTFPCGQPGRPRRSQPDARHRPAIIHYASPAWGNYLLKRRPATTTSSCRHYYYVRRRLPQFLRGHRADGELPGPGRDPQGQRPAAAVQPGPARCSSTTPSGACTARAARASGPMPCSATPTSTA